MHGMFNGRLINDMNTGIYGSFFQFNQVFLNQLLLYIIYADVKNDDFARYSSLMWLGDGERATQSLNFQGLGVSPWLQPRIDTPLLGLKPDTYQQMAAAALEEIRAGDPSKQSSALLQFQQTQNLNGGLNSVYANHALQQMQYQTQQTVQHGNSQYSGNSGFIQSQLQQLHLHNPQQLQNQQELPPQQQRHQGIQQQSHKEMQQQLSSSCHHISDLDSRMSGSESASQPQSPFYQQNLLEGNTDPSLHLHNGFRNFSSQDASNLVSLPRGDQLMSPDGWPSKRLALEPHGHIESRSVQPKLENINHQTNISHFAGTLTPQSARDCSSVQAYGSNVDNQLYSSSFAFQDGMASVRGGSGSGTVSMAIPLVRYGGEDLPPADTLATSSCLGESGNFNSLDSVCGVNPSQGETFVKVCVSYLCVVSL
jgi:hypothetical protein